MSRIGKIPIKIPDGVKINLEDQKLKISGPKGELILPIPYQIEVKINNGVIICQAKKDQSPLWGLTRTLINNAVIGVSQDWTKTLELVGVGFRANTEGEELVLTVGFSHPVKIKAPPGISFTVSENKIQVSGVDKQLVGEVAANLRRIRPPEPYKGKGIKYQEEKIRRKVGKVAKVIGAAVPAGGKI
ncbi:MAG: large subunit ribosomal protein L6 [Microgenomates group bacterium LiPW_16]|nr:MAG: large subunit ribosomal protein L6 [Microgenomates group bacterium LiPW_16]